jgi:hypothetical protein
MSNTIELENRVRKLEKKLCCISIPKDTFGDFPTVGTQGVIYIDKEFSDLYLWDGSSYVLIAGADKVKIEIPNTEFADVSNPDIQEVRTWANANLTTIQKINSELYMVEEPQDVTRSYPAISTFINIGISGATNIVTLDNFYINGTQYIINEPLETSPSVKLTDFTPLEAKLNAAFISAGFTGYTFVVSYGGPGTNFLRVNFTGGTGTPDTFEYGYDYTNDAGTPVVGGTLTYITSVTINSTGSTINEPDYVWDIINDDLTELHRRENHGNVWWIDASIPDHRKPFAQKGNPNRPLQTLADINTYANLVDGDKVIFRAGDYAQTLLTKGNVIYHFEEGAVITGALAKVITVPDTESLTITGYLETLAYFEKNGTGDVNINVKSYGTVLLKTHDGDAFITADLASRDIAQHHGACNSNLKFYVKKVESVQVISTRIIKSGITVNGRVDVALISDASNPSIWSVLQDDNIDVNISIGRFEFVGVQSDVIGGFISNGTTGAGTSFLNNSNIYIEVDYMDMPSASTAAASGLVNFSLLNGCTNTNIHIHVKNGNCGWNLFKSGGVTLTNSTIRFSGAFDINQTLSAVSTPVLDANSKIVIDGDITTLNNNLIVGTGVGSVGKIIVQNSKLTSVKEIVSSDVDLVAIYNSVLTNDATVDIVTLATPGNVAISAVATNTTTTDANVTEVGGIVVRHGSII